MKLAADAEPVVDRDDRGAAEQQDREGAAEDAGVLSRLAIELVVSTDELSAPESKSKTPTTG